MVTKIAFLANCQGKPLTNIVNACLDDVSATYYSNNKRTGDFISADAIADRLQNYDIIVYQPLGQAHGAISHEEIQKRYGSKTLLRIPNIFNSGTTSLGYAPASPKNSYGEVYGEKYIIDMINAGLSESLIAKNISDGSFSPSVRERFFHDINEFIEREKSVDVKVSDFIMENYRKNFLFITHNHPTFYLFSEIVLNVVKLAMPEKAPVLERHLHDVDQAIVSLQYTGAPVSPHDVEAHGYQFGYHSDWREKQTHLIHLVWRKHANGEDVKPDIPPSRTMFPDAV